MVKNLTILSIASIAVAISICIILNSDFQNAFGIRIAENAIMEYHLI